MKILCVNSLDARYGSTYRIRALAELLRKNGFDVQYVEHPGNPISKITIAKWKAVFSSYDLLFTQKFNPITIPTLLLARLRGKPAVVDWDDIDAGLQGNPPKRIIASLCERFGPYLASFITTHSEPIRSRAERFCPSEIVPQGFDGELFQPDRYSKTECRKRWGFSDSDFVVGHLCTFTTGGTLDLDAILKSWTEPPLHSTRFFLIGGGPSERSVRRKVRDLGLQERVTWSGLLPHEEIPRALACLDVGVVFMSDRTANLARVSFKVIEYLAMNVPVVGQVVGETAYRFGNLIHTAGDGAFAEVTAKIGTEKKPTATATAVAAYDWNVAAGRVVEIVRQVLNKGS